MRKGGRERWCCVQGILISIFGDIRRCFIALVELIGSPPTNPFPPIFGKSIHKYCDSDDEIYFE